MLQWKTLEGGVEVSRHLFLQGEIGSGKSSLIREALLPYLDKVGGFFVQRVFIAGRYAAFKLTPLTTAAEYNVNLYVDDMQGLDNLFLYCDDHNKWQIDLRVFAKSGVACLQHSRNASKKLVLMDELGGVEFACLPFMKAVWEVLNGPIPALGVLKLPRNLGKLKKESGGQSENEVGYKYSLQSFKQHPEVELASFNADNYEQVKARVNKFVEDIML
jgi:nucleoside-triphosphatase